MKQASALKTIQITTAWIAILFPVLIVVGKGPAEVGIMISAVLLLIHSAITRDFKFLRESWVIAAGALWIYLVVRSLFAPDIQHALAKSVLFIRFILFAICLEFIVSKDKKVSSKIFIALGLILIFLTLDGFIQFFVGHDLLGKPRIGNRLTGPFSKPILGTAIASFGIIAVAGLIPLLKKTTKHLFAILSSAMLIFTIVFLTGERAALLRFIISIALLCLGMFLMCKDAKTKRNIFMILLATVGLFLIGAGVISLLSTEMAERQISSSIREATNHQSSSYLFLWATGLKAGLSNILFGVGPNHFESFCNAHPHPTMHWCGNDLNTYMHPHNVWIEFFAESGLVGIALFSILLYELAKKLINFCKTRTDFFACALVIGVGLSAFQRLLPLPSSSFFKNWYAIPIWFAIGWMLCIIRVNQSHTPHK